MRNLASVQVIDRVAPIEGADFIEQAAVLGWTMVIKKGEFSPGDKCVFFEIDSLLPESQPWAEFMRKHHFVVRTVRLKRVLAQGLALPVSIIGPDGSSYPVGTGVTDLLGVQHYEKDLPDDPRFCGPFPAFVPKTGELRLQSVPTILDEIAGHDFYVTTKIDGCSTTFFRSFDGQKLHCCLRNWEVTPGDHPVWAIAGQHALTQVLPPGFALQGELTGPGIPGKKNILGLDAPTFFAFNLRDVRNDRFFDYEDFISFCRTHDIPTVPVERVVTGEQAVAYAHSIQGWLQAATGFYAGTKTKKEGIVVRTTKAIRSKALSGSRLSFKVINNLTL